MSSFTCDTRIKGPSGRQPRTLPGMNELPGSSTPDGSAEYLGRDRSDSRAADLAPSGINVAEGTVEVKNRLGLHMGPTTMVAKTAIKYLSTITIARGNKQASARSASSLERLKAKAGTHLNDQG